MALRWLASGNRPRPALILSARCAGFVVPGITAVTASWPSRNFRKNCGQVVASKSRAHSGTLLPRTAENTELRPNGSAVLTALPFGRSSVFSAVRGKSVPEWARDFDATTWPQFFLKFLLGHEAVTAVIPGTTNPAHLADNISAGRGRFPDAKQRKAMIEFFESF